MRNRGRFSPEALSYQRIARKGRKLIKNEVTIVATIIDSLRFLNFDLASEITFDPPDILFSV